MSGLTTRAQRNRAPPRASITRRPSAKAAWAASWQGQAQREAVIEAVGAALCPMGDVVRVQRPGAPADGAAEATRRDKGRPKARVGVRWECLAMARRGGRAGAKRGLTDKRGAAPHGGPSSRRSTARICRSSSWRTFFRSEISPS